jgi:translation initiation factor IF-2/pilus assembly protein FimV
MSTAAIAQTTTPDTTTPPADPMATTTPSDAATSPVVMPDNTAPRVDNMGNPVISAPATAPSGFNQAPGMNGVGGPYVDPSQPPAPMAATGDYPPCSRTVTDHCIQTYERGIGRARRHR